MNMIADETVVSASGAPSIWGILNGPRIYEFEGRRVIAVLILWPASES
jgi:hypothetical protein